MTAHQFLQVESDETNLSTALHESPTHDGEVLWCGGGGGGGGEGGGG